MSPRPGLIAVIVFTLIIVLTGTHHHEKIKTAWATVLPPRFTKVVCFGDSLSDAGNGAWQVTNKTWPSHPGYVNHRFSNGPVHSEYVAQDLLLPLVSYATGGASISTRVSSKSGAHGDWPVDCILEQIAKYSVGKDDESGTVFIIYAGANDAFFSVTEGSTSPAEVIEDLTSAITALKKIGGRHFIVPTLPPLGESYPYANTFPDAAGPMGEFSTEYRKQLFAWSRTDKTVAIADFYYVYSGLMAEPEKHGFNPAKMKLGCIKDLCKNWKEYIWFDDFHPTTYVHRLLADESLKALNYLTKGRHLTSKLLFRRER